MTARIIPGSTRALVLVAASVITSASRAQDATPPDPAAPAPEPAKAAEGSGVRTTFELFAGYQFKTDLENNGSVSASRAGGQLDVMVPVGEHDRLIIDMAAQATFYSFDNATTLDPTGDPIGTAEYFALSGRYFHRLAERWGVYAGAGISSSGEPGADFGETLQYGAGFGVTYFFSESLSITPGLFVRTQLEESVLFVPMLNIDWQINEEWRLATIMRAAGTAPGLSLSYSPSKEWTFAVSASYESRAYRLDDSGSNPGGVFFDRRVPFDVSAKWNFAESASLEATAGVAMWGEFKTRDSSGNEVATEDLDAAPFAGLTLVFRF